MSPMPKYSVATIPLILVLFAFGGCDHADNHSAGSAQATRLGGASATSQSARAQPPPQSGYQKARASAETSETPSEKYLAALDKKLRKGMTPEEVERVLDLFVTGEVSIPAATMRGTAGGYALPSGTWLPELSVWPDSLQWPHWFFYFQQPASTGSVAELRRPSSTPQTAEPVVFQNRTVLGWDLSPNLADGTHAELYAAFLHPVLGPSEWTDNEVKKILGSVAPSPPKTLDRWIIVRGPYFK